MKLLAHVLIKKSITHMVLTQEISIDEVSADMDISVDQIKMH